MKIKSFAAFSLAVICLVTIVNIVTNPDSICYVFNSEFRGEFRIYTNDRNSVPLQKHNWTWEIVIPKDGILRIPTTGPFSKWHHATAKTESGVLLKINNGAVALRPNDVAIRETGASAHGYFFGFVGTENDFNVWMSRKRGAFDD